MSEVDSSTDSGVDSALPSPEIMTKTTPRPKKPKGRANLPISIGKEHQIIQAAVQAALTAVKDFKNKHKSESDVCVERCVSFATDTLPSFRVETIEFDTWEDYETATSSRRVDKRIKEREEFHEIHDLCETGRGFKENVLSCYGKLHKAAFGHLYKYCLSFSEVVDPEVDISIAKKYDDLIFDMRKELQRWFKLFKDLRSGYFTKCSPFLDWLVHYKDVEKCMTAICDVIVNICNGMKAWVRRDEMYPRDLHNAANVESHLRANAQKKLNKHQHHKATLSNELQRKTREHETIHKEYNILRARRKRFWSSLETVEYKQERIQATADGKDLELEKLERQYDRMNERVKPGKYNDEWAIKLFKKTKSELTDVQHDSDKLHEELKACERQIDRIRNDQRGHEDAIYETKIELKEAEVGKKDAGERLAMFDLETERLQEEITRASKRFEEIQRLRDYKLLPDSLRRIYFTQKVLPEEEQAKPLDKALDMVSKYIGEDWKRLYVTLPFQNKREKERKERDVETLDIISPRFDLTLEDRAKRSLEKWKLMYRKATVRDLVKSLKRIEKSDLAESVEEACM
ncbi:uncharacterized protein LOC135501409 [Lineus longissimus]|uniref:uncharacterized protein LOC135501409 n=1 Tax=Lineus longissimus TaxID=88925 RepID=UPI00315C99C5